jgi:glycogen operon protein
MTTSAALSGAPVLQPGDGMLLGAQLGRDAIQFALAAPNATAVDLCLFDAAGQRETVRLRMPEPHNGVWSGALPLGPGIGAGLVYGWRVHGPWAPHEGHRFNPAKLLLDPAARAVLGHYTGDDLHLGHDPRSPAGDLPDLRDNAATALKARVVADLPQPSTSRPRPDPARRVIYELHIKGFTALHPEVPASQRGRYAGLAHPAVLAHLQSLGVTTVCLMPVAHRADEARLQALGMSNYWGYSPVAWSAPETRYASEGPDSDARSEFRAMVEALHGGGLEVVLDVVYNHTAELDEWGPTLSLRGIDNALYYHLLPHERSGYANWTGCGNCLNFDQPLVRRTVLESLRRWVVEFGVDGFRFDLAPVLARGGDEVQGRFQPDAPLLQAIASDPVLGQRLMIAEPWDIGAGGYQLGAFPPGWLEWNDRYRDTQRSFWLHRHSSRGAFANRLAGSSDVFRHAGRGPHSSVNFITAHDGFTLRDLVSYAQRHNQANGEDNRDGHANNLSTNNGVEGETDAPSVLDRRARQQRVLLASLVLSLGTPMLLAGDEFGHSQGGNNNAYCQDNPTTWLNWARADRGLCAFVQAALALRQGLAVLQASHWWQTGASDQGPQAGWWTAGGQPMSALAWEEPHSQALSLRLQGVGQSVLLLFNPEPNPVRFTLPPGAWRLRLDTAASDPSAPAAAGLWLRPTEDVAPGALWMAVAESSSA